MRIFWWRQEVGTGDTSIFAAFASNSLREGVCVTGPQIPLHPSTCTGTTSTLHDTGVPKRTKVLCATR